MNRLTILIDNGLDEICFEVPSDREGLYNIFDVANLQDDDEKAEILFRIAERLKAYEDTGLEPEELQEYLRRHNFKELHDHISELLDLEGQGLLIKLPCKVGDTVYKLDDYGEWHGYKIFMPIKCKVNLILISNENEMFCNLTSIDEYLQTGSTFDEVPLSEIYLLKEEAEKAAEEKKNE